MSWRLQGADDVDAPFSPSPGCAGPREPQNAFRDFETGRPLLFSRLPGAAPRGRNRGRRGMNWYKRRAGARRCAWCSSCMAALCRLAAYGHSYAALAGALVSQRSGIAGLPAGIFACCKRRRFPPRPRICAPPGRPSAPCGHDPSRIAIAGDSAGGNLALTLCSGNSWPREFRPAAFLGFSPLGRSDLVGRKPVDQPARRPDPAARAHRRR